MKAPLRQELHFLYIYPANQVYCSFTFSFSHNGHSCSFPNIFCKKRNCLSVQWFPIWCVVHKKGDMQSGLISAPLGSDRPKFLHKRGRKLSGNWNRAMWLALSSTQFSLHIPLNPKHRTLRAKVVFTVSCLLLRFWEKRDILETKQRGLIIEEG